jgi:hypothetical protein
VNRYSNAITQPNFATIIDPTNCIIRRSKKAELFCFAVWPYDIDDIRLVTNASYTEDRTVSRHDRIPESKADMVGGWSTTYRWNQSSRPNALAASVRATAHGQSAEPSATGKKINICRHGLQTKARPSSFIGSLQAGHCGVMAGTERPMSDSVPKETRDHQRKRPGLRNIFARGRCRSRSGAEIPATAT